MPLVKLLMPKMGESIVEATILSWLKKEGDSVNQDEFVVEVATDKVDTEVPSAYGGVLQKILAKNGAVVAVGKPIAIISTDGKEESEETTEKGEEAYETLPETATPTPVNGMYTGGYHAAANRFYSPLVKSIARKEGISEAELEAIKGTGKQGRVTKYDILAYLEALKRRQEYALQGAAALPQSSAHPAPAYVDGTDEIIEMDRMRKLIAQRMIDSRRISPHVTSFVEADVTNIVFWRNRNKHEFKRREGGNLTFTPIFIYAVAKAIKDYPMINVQVDGDRIIRKKNINIGMAVALPSGNLVVPVVRNADQLNITGLANKVNELVMKARNNKLSADELADGTFTISNVGSFGNLMGTPIIVQPQVAIMALGTVVKKPAVIETPSGDAIAIRHKMFLSHSYDHRVVDGSLGGMVVRRVADYLERFDMKQGI